MLFLNPVLSSGTGVRGQLDTHKASKNLRALNAFIFTHIPITKTSHVTKPKMNKEDYATYQAAANRKDKPISRAYKTSNKISVS